MGINDIDLVTYGSQGMILKLNSYIDQYAPDLLTLFKDYPEVEKAFRFPDGNMYSFYGVTKHPRDMSKHRFWLNKKWAETLGVPVPTTLDEFYTYLKAVKDGDPNGNGDTNDEIPLVAMYGPQDTTVNEYDISIPILTAMGLSSNRIEVVNGIVSFVPANPIYKEYSGLYEQTFY